MRSLAFAICALLVFCCSVPVLGGQQEAGSAVDPKAPETFRFSVGVNDLPWDATGISFRWWKNARSGREFVVSDVSGTYNDVTLGDNDENGYGFSIGSIRYGFLHRRPSDILKGLYITGGTEFGIGVQITVDRQPAYIVDAPNAERRHYAVSASCYVPVGVEHFFVERFPNLSYSVEATISLTMRYGRDAYYEPEPQRDRITDEVRAAIGVRPLFYFRCYF